jgi:hypothetical protein
MRTRPDTSGSSISRLGARESRSLGSVGRRWRSHLTAIVNSEGLIATGSIVHSQPLPLPSMQVLPRLLSQTLPRQLLTGVK